MKIFFTTHFVREFNGQEKDLQDEIAEKIKLLEDPKNHKSLKVHKLKGKLKNQSSFSVNYKIRVTFISLDRNKITLLDIGDHDIYK